MRPPTTKQAMRIGDSLSICADCNRKTEVVLPRTGPSENIKTVFLRTPQSRKTSHALIAPLLQTVEIKKDLKFDSSGRHTVRTSRVSASHGDVRRTTEQIRLSRVTNKRSLSG